MDVKNLIMYTDGGCSGNPGVGGWAFVLAGEDGHAEMEKSGGSRYTTNNKMELTAVIEGLKYCLEAQAGKVTVHTDSQYVKNGITAWISNWKKNNWKTAARKPVKNQELWKELDSLNASLDVSWQWVKGHAGIELNERCDTLVGLEMDKLGR
ncbi:MAG: ribonuclease HI [Spirochaetia bacterium]|jgi:ribonuclease HI|nr:ribonuclease HI [Spirochaetia bacterium]